MPGEFFPASARRDDLTSRPSDNSSMTRSFARPQSHDGFIEEFDTADLPEAQALLEELS
jgi:hypothetical protein